MNQSESALGLLPPPADESDPEPHLSTVGLGIAPRTALLALLVINIIALSMRSQAALYAVAIMSLAALASAGRPKVFWPISLVIVGCFAVFNLVPLLSTSNLSMFFATLGYWFSRFGVSAAIGAYLLLTITASDMISTLYRLRAPSFLSVPLTVMLRYLPSARQEMVAIREAMSLRGIPVNLSALLRHPLRTVEYLVVPLLVSSSRLADDLTASGLVRGLGGNARPTPLRDSEFSWRDAVAIVAVVGVFGFAIWEQVQ